MFTLENEILLAQSPNNIFVLFAGSQSPETQHGAILALGYMVGRYMSKRKEFTTGDSPNKMETGVSKEDDELVALATKTIGMYSYAGVSLRRPEWKLALKKVCVRAHSH